MKKYICLILFSLFAIATFGQKNYEHRLATAIDIGTHDKPFTFTDISRYTGDFTDDFDWSVEYPSSYVKNDVFYRVTLTHSLKLKFNVTRSDGRWSWGYLLDDTGKRLDCASTSDVSFGLIPGVYYIVIEEYDSMKDSMIDVIVEGVPRATGEDFLCPFELGNFNASFNIKPSAPNIKSFKSDYRSPSKPNELDYIHDVVFHFTLDCPMNVRLSQFISYNKYIFYQSSLLNAFGDTLCVSNSIEGDAKLVDLSAGEYYVYGWCKYYWDGDGSFSFSLSGSAKDFGYDLSYPVEIGSRSSNFTYTDTRNTSYNITSKQPEKAGKEMHYRMTLTEPMKIDINTCGSPMADTYLKVFSADKKLMFYNDDYSGAGACSNTQSACLQIPSLTPGTYYIVTDAASNGELTTSVTGTVITNPGDTPSIAIELGSHRAGFSYSDIRDTSLPSYTNSYPGKPTRDVYYRFTLEQPLDVSIDHEGSTLANTSLTLLNSSQALVKSSANSSGRASLELKQLPAGTYYVVSEGISLNGQITTNINIWGAYGDLNTTIGQPHIIRLTPTATTSDLSTLRSTELVQEIQYFNHLGLPTEKIQRGFTPGRNDLVSLQEYDGLDRETKQWLPVPAEDAAGAYVHPTQVRQTARESILYGNDSHPYSQTQYDGSQLGRVTRQFGAGKDWQLDKKSVQTDYHTNSRTEAALTVKSYSCTETALTCAGNYPNSTLFIVKTIDEDSNVSYEFKDKTGIVLLTRQQTGSEYSDTYHVYDQSGNVRFVLPPLAADALTGSNTTWNEDNTTLKKYAYIYKYDKYNRCIYKKLPGCEPVYTVYDKADRPIFTQDGVQRDKGEWTFSIPDAFGRVVVTGTCKNTLSYASNPLDTVLVKATLTKTTSTTKGYSISGVTLNTPVTLITNYYDTYDFIGQNDILASTTAYETVAGYGKRYSGGCRGQQTGSLVARLSKTGSVTSYLYSVLYYDERGRLIQQKGNNELNGTNQIYTAYNFTGKPTQVKQVRVIPGKDTTTELRKHTYDHADRLLRTTYQLNSDPVVTLVDNVYDEAGRLKTDRRNGNTNLKTDYAYNVRSWTKSITGPLFSQTLCYQEKIEGNTPCYNGNISSMHWNTSQLNNESGYRFTYDGLNRMKDAIYGEGNTLATNANRFNEQITGYDKMGNILGLLRYGQTGTTTYGLIDNLNLTYEGNQLQSVNDAATNSVFGNGMEFKDGANQTIEYTYDKNGNLTKDLNKNITSIQYNLLNLSSQVVFGSGNTISYEYGADGRKLRTVHTIQGTTTTTDYCGNAIYENGVLKMLLNESGYVSLPDKKFHFYLKDHQGNVRLVADKDGNVEETNSYYPFGGTFTTATSVQPYKYNGKELDAKGGLNLYDYGARRYDAAIGRWCAVDPMADRYRGVSPYNYCVNNPILFVDPNGKWPTWNSLKNGITEAVGSSLSFVNGATRAVSDNLLLGVTSFREAGLYTDASAYNAGQDIGDALSVVMGAGEVMIGGAKAIGGVLAAPETSGLSLAVTAEGSMVATHGSMMAFSGTKNLTSKKGRVSEGGSSTSTSKGTLSGAKSALKEVHEKVGGSLPKGEVGKKGSPQRGDAKKGYRLDPGHPNRPAGDPENGPHINWWDYTKGKRKGGGTSGAIPIE